jgi:uncharacterized membrane protein (GlpM family)
MNEFKTDIDNPRSWQAMQFFIKILISTAIISGCAAIGRRFPSLAGLIATMPITTLIVLFWLQSDSPEDFHKFAEFSKGVVWGIVPSMLFFIMAYVCFRKEVPFLTTIGLSFGIWLLGAVVHQWLLR